MTRVWQLCRSLHMGRIVPELEPSVAKQMALDQLEAKQLRSRRKMGMVRLPAQLQLAAESKLKRYSTAEFRSEAKMLINLMSELKLPDDPSTIALKRADLKTQLELRDKIKERADYDPSEFALHEESTSARQDLANIIQGKLEDKRRDWHYYEFDEYACNLYMATRLAPNYACLRTVMKEIHDLDSTFEPKSVLDFGSGMGTTMWAVNSTWPNSVEEFMNVDISKEQQYLSELLLRKGEEFGKPLPGVFYKQYLPVSDKAKYNMVVAAFSMLELPSLELRAQTIENLWNKTNDLLIIIERGNEGGFATVNEARHLVLDLEGHQVTGKANLSPVSQLNAKLVQPDAHVMAPCSHEFLCSKLALPSKGKRNICKYRVVFEPLEFGEKKKGLLREEFSYVVLRKKPYHSYFTSCRQRWPRIVERRKKSGGLVNFLLCCPNGNLAETAITKKYGKDTYNVAKASDWGDILPIKVIDDYGRKPSFIDKKTKGCGDNDKSTQEQDLSNK